MKLVGRFECSSGTLVVSDLCYLGNESHREHAIALRAAPGFWSARYATAIIHDSPLRVDRDIVQVQAVREGSLPTQWHLLEADLCRDTPIIILLDRAAILDGRLAGSHLQINNSLIRENNASDGICLLPYGIACVDCFDTIRAELRIAMDSQGLVEGIDLQFVTGSWPEYHWEYCATSGAMIQVHLSCDRGLEIWGEEEAIHPYRDFSFDFGLDPSDYRIPPYENMPESIVASIHAAIGLHRLQRPLEDRPPSEVRIPFP